MKVYLILQIKKFRIHNFSDALKRRVKEAMLMIESNTNLKNCMMN